MLRVLIAFATAFLLLGGLPARVQAQDTRVPKWSVNLDLDSHFQNPGLVVSPGGLIHVRGYLAGRQDQPVIRTYRPDSGDKVWEHILPARSGGVSDSSATVGDDGTVFTLVGPDLFAFNATNGVLRWQQSLEIHGGGITLATDGTLLVWSQSILLAVGPANGAVRWTARHGVLFSSPPVLATNGRLYFGAYFGDTNHGVWSVNPSTGLIQGFYHHVNRIPGESPGPTSLIPLQSGQILVGQSNYYSLDATLTQRPATLLGTVAFGTQPIETTNGLVLTGTRYYGPASTALFGAHDPMTGQQRWGVGVTNPSTAALAADGTAYVVGQSRIRLPGSTNFAVSLALHALSASTGTILWTSALDWTAAHPPILTTDGMLYVRTTGHPDGGTLHAFEVGRPPAPDVWAMDRADARGTGRHPAVSSPTPALTLLSQPQDLTVPAGENAAFSVVAQGAEPLFYTWFRNGISLPDARSPELTLPNVALADAGDYWVVVSNRFNRRVQSRNARLTVTPPTSETILYFDHSLVISNATGPDTLAGDVIGPAAAARFHSLNGGFVAPNGDLYLADTGNHRIKKLTPDGLVMHVAGTGRPGYVNGPAETAQFRDPIGVCAAPDGTVYVADYGNHVVRRISSDGQVSTHAGIGLPGFEDQIRERARFNHPNDLVLAPDGVLFVTDFDNHAVRRVARDGRVTTWAGTGIAGNADGHRIWAQFNRPAGIALGACGDLFVTEWGQPRIRRITPEGLVLVHAGTGEPGYQDGPNSLARFREPDGIVADAFDNLFITDRGNHAVRRISAQGLVQTVAGTGEAGHLGSYPGGAQFSQPSGLGLAADGTLFVADTGNHRLRRIPLAGSLSAYELAVLADGPTSYWQLGNGDSASWPVTPALDVMARNPGTYFGDPRWSWISAIVADRPDLAAAFYRQLSLHIDVPFHPDLNRPAFSIELWALVDRLGNLPYEELTLAGTSHPSVPRGWMLRALHPGEWEFALGDGNRWVAVVGTPVQEAAWTHLVGTFDGQRARLYINGMAVAGRNATHLGAVGAALRFGQSGFAGALDEVAYYPRALPPQCVLAHYGAGVNPRGVTARLIQGRPTIVWSSGALTASPTATGPWTVLPEATSPQSVDINVDQQFFRTTMP